MSVSELQEALAQYSLTMTLKENFPTVHVDVQFMLMVTVVHWSNKLPILCYIDWGSWVFPADTAILAVPTCTMMHREGTSSPEVVMAAQCRKHSNSATRVAANIKL